MSQTISSNPKPTRFQTTASVHSRKGLSRVSVHLSMKPHKLPTKRFSALTTEQRCRTQQFILTTASVGYVLLLSQENQRRRMLN